MEDDNENELAKKVKTDGDLLRLNRDLKNLLENPVVLASPVLLKLIGHAITEAGKMLFARAKQEDG